MQKISEKMRTSSSFSSSSSSNPRRCQTFDDLFKDFPRPIRDQLIISSKEIVKQYLAKTTTEIRGLSRITLGVERERSSFMEDFVRLMGELDVAEAAGMEVEQYRERLERLKWVADTYEEGLRYADDLRRKKQRLMLEVDELHSKEVECRSGMEDCQIWFYNWADFSWNEGPIQTCQEGEVNVDEPSMENPEAPEYEERNEAPKEDQEEVEEEEDDEEDDNEDIEKSVGDRDYDPTDKC